MKLRRYARTADEQDQEAHAVFLRIENPGEWRGVPEGSTVILEVNDSPGQLVSDMARYREVLSEETVGQLGELRPRLLDFLDRAAALGRTE